MKIEKLRKKLLELLLEINEMEDDEIQYAIDKLNDISYDVTYNE